MRRLTADDRERQIFALRQQVGPVPPEYSRSPASLHSPRRKAVDEAGGGTGARSSSNDSLGVACRSIAASALPHSAPCASGMMPHGDCSQSKQGTNRGIGAIMPSSPADYLPDSRRYVPKPRDMTAVSTRRIAGYVAVLAPNSRSRTGVTDGWLPLPPDRHHLE